MGRTFIQQDTQIYSSFTYDDTGAAGSTLESGAATLQDDLNSVRAQLKRILGTANWYSALSNRSLATVDTDLADIEAKKLLFRAQVLTDVTVPASQNWVVLSVAGSETPSETAAVGAVTTNGAVVAAHAGTFGTTHSVTEVAGATAISPKNMCLVRDAVTGQPIQSDNGKDVYALLHSESASDGHTFDDATSQVQLSFVRENTAGNDLEACPVADIENKVVNYSYVRRINLDAIPESAFLAGAFIDQTASVDVTLNNAIDNQSGAATQAQNIRWQIADAVSLDFEDSAGTKDLFKIAPNVAGDAISFNTDDWTLTNANTATMTNGLAVDTSGTQINLGATAGQIDSAGALTVLSGGSADLALRAAGEMYLDDGNQAGSTWAQTAGIKLTDTTQEWDDFEAAFGEVSLLKAIYMANSAAARVKGVAVVTEATIAANTNVTGAGGTPNIDAQLPAYVSGDFVTGVDVYLNGMLLRNGADNTANHDVYPGTTPANGDLMFEFILKGGLAPDVITMVVY